MAAGAGHDRPCRRLPGEGIPVTGGNVSLYNSSGTVKGTPTSSINPTPVVGVLGVMEDVTAPASGLCKDGSALVLLGDTRDELDGSAWARIIHGHLGGKPPVADLEAEMALDECCWRYTELSPTSLAG